MCLLYLYKCSRGEPETADPEICRYQEASKREEPTDLEEDVHVYMKMQTHICYTACEEW